MNRLAECLSTVILFYDFIITLEAEVHHVWKRKFTTVTALFLLNRYLNLVLSAANLLTFFPYVPMSGVSSIMLISKRSLNVDFEHDFVRYSESHGDHQFLSDLI